MKEKEKLIEVKNLNKYFRVGKRKVLKAVDDVSFNIYKGETLGLVGESGCGKSTIGRTIIQLYNATSGQVIFDGEDVQKKSPIEIKKMKKKMQMIFQDPYSSLNPRMTVLEIIAEGIGNHEAHLTNMEKEAKVHELLESVGLTKKHAHRYPHEFSGGQRQRIGIARALAVEPEFIIADEPIAALDVSIQAQIVNLMQELQEKKGLTYLFIAHDLSMVKHISDRIAVMYLGSIVELAASEDLYENPLHPYSQALLSAIPIPDPKVERTRERIILEGDVPNPMDIPSGCRFHTRCPKAMHICTETTPLWKEVSVNHFTACHLNN
ncbi:MAG: ATP-binding cassette domain-containing protein [Bacillus sp. (in: Bacteria)]|nr:ATP-binding cassette domain-containing protein [Bacillus sp. (in: firmicutes)]